jgi:multidrug resistance efflux pump
MKVSRHSFLRLSLLALMVAGAWATETGRLVHSSGVAESDNHNGLSSRVLGSVVCFGYVDVESGIRSLYPLQPGRVEEVDVSENQEVRAGTVLLRLDKGQAEGQVRQARADLEAGQVRLSQARKAVRQQQLKEAQQQAVIEAVRQRVKASEWLLARKAELRGTLVNDKEFAAAQAQNEEAKAVLCGEQQKLEELKLVDPQESLRLAEIDAEVRQARLDLAQVALGECDLKAPCDGTVLRLLAARGDVLSAQPLQPAVLFCPRGPRVIRAEVEQEFAPRVAVNHEASIEDDNTTAATWRGKVVRVSDWYTHRRSILLEPLQQNDVRTLECLIELAPGQPPLRIGQRVRVTLGPPAGRDLARP